MLVTTPLLRLSSCETPIILCTLFAHAGPFQLSCSGQVVCVCVCENGLAFLHSQRKENTEGRAVRDGGNSNWNTSSGLAQSENRREGRAGLRALNEGAANAEY